MFENPCLNRPNKERLSGRAHWERLSRRAHRERLSGRACRERLSGRAHQERLSRWAHQERLSGRAPSIEPQIGPAHTGPIRNPQGSVGIYRESV